MGEEPSIPVIVERIKNVQEDVTEIKLNMATRTDQAHVDDRIKDLVGALASEKAERIAAIDKEALERKTEVGKVKDRLQLVEDRLEARKYNVGIAILLSAVGVVLGILGTAGQALLGGG